jgi:hypothetical protein
MGRTRKRHHLGRRPISGLPGIGIIDAQVD